MAGLYGVHRRWYIRRRPLRREWVGTKLGLSALTPGQTVHTRAIYGAIVSPKLAPSFTTHTRAIYTATVSPKLKPGLITHTRAIYSPLVFGSYTLFPGLTTHTRAIYAISKVSPSLVPGLISHTRVMYTPRLSPQVQPGFIDRTSRAAYPASLTARATDVNGELWPLSEHHPIVQPLTYTT